MNLTYAYQMLSVSTSLSGDSDIHFNRTISSPRPGGTYGSVAAPSEFGSGGGSAPGMMGQGGYGGGIVHINFRTSLFIENNSRVSADGANGYYNGGGGAGGSVWIRSDSNGTVSGNGRITADGGKTCFVPGCSVSVQYPSGSGGGGRVSVDAWSEPFGGLVSARSGVDPLSNEVYVTSQLGSIYQWQPTMRLVYTHNNISSEGEEAIDVEFIESPVRLVQLITTSGTGTGSRDAVDASDAIVKGSWRVGYRY